MRARQGRSRGLVRSTRYFSGFLGDAQILMFDGGEREHPTRPEETVHVWRLMVQERDPARRPQAREAPAKPSASPVARGDGWRGPSSYRRAMNERSRAPAGEDGALPEDTLEDLYR